MENIPGKFGKTVKDCRLPEQTKRKKHWTLLLVEDCGETVRIPFFRFILIFWALLTLAAVGTAAFYYYRYRDAVSEKQTFSALPADKEQQGPSPLPGIRRDNEKKLTAAPGQARRTPHKENQTGKEKLPVSLSSKPDGPAEKNPDLPDTGSENKGESAGEKIPENAETQKQTVKAEEGTEKPAENLPNPKDARVSVDDFVWTYTESAGKLHVRFNIRNADPDAGPVSGEIFLLLETGISSGKSLLLPGGNAVSGSPPEDAQGERFSISRFKTVEMEARNVGGKKHFTQARVFVYDDERHILLKQDAGIVFQ
ncbi:MAG: hypothetical protein V2I97_15825 [Desulfococcaceae bacterium]|jgi:hypothetical protein|nr:hypothetical protein [Desulfococcaceae bacterium]